jgi:undecaprenyl diphosphate synthase
VVVEMSESINMPRHVAIVMDGNGRWAKQRFMPRIAGHRAGVNSVQNAIDFCIRHRIEVLSLFALSVENFQSRPESEVQFLISLLSDMLLKKLNEMHANRIRIRVMGDLSVFESAVQAQILHAQTTTKDNDGLTLVIAINYSGRWDIFQAAQQFSQYAISNNKDPSALVEKDFSQFLCLHDLPEPDLLIRTSGEQRISNFMLWQCAYTELYFTETLWPDFSNEEFSRALQFYAQRQRRYGLTSEQIENETSTLQ